jgi:putative oxygen-independent coproporphyrinogen III oxidase
MAGIYLHIPFCKQACNYCDFHFSTNTKYIDKMVQAMQREIVLKKDYLEHESYTIETIYFGGGTPSLIDTKHIRSLLETIQMHHKVASNLEITLEANPDDLDLEKLKALKTIGINRLSIGLQSFRDEELRWMNRAHNARESIECLQNTSIAGFDNISVDLIYGSQLLSDENWEQQLLHIEKLPIQHLSCYALTVEDKTALGHAVKSKILPDVEDDKQERHFKMLQSWAQHSGFDHYEISNLGKPNKHSKHNSAYWDNKPYIGIGPSAHSYNGKSRQWNINNNAVYLKLIDSNTDYFEKEELQEKDHFNELVLTQLRTRKGLRKELISSSFDSKIIKHFEKELKKLKRKNQISELEGSIYIPYENWFMADGIASDLFYTN